MKNKMLVGTVVAITFGFVGIGYSKYGQLNRMQSQVYEKEQDIAQVSSEIEELNKQFDYSNSLGYVEKIAREQLGYIMPDEIIFVD